MEVIFFYGTIKRSILRLASRRVPDSFGLFLSTIAFTLIELMIVIGIIGTLASFGLVHYRDYIDKARLVVVISDIREIENAIDLYEIDNQDLPETLADCGRGDMKDPWGNPYRYARLSDLPKGKWRKDRFLVPINTDYDLYSMGKDGDSKPPFTAKASRDDIVRANDGGYVGRAIEY